MKTTNEPLFLLSQQQKDVLFMLADGKSYVGIEKELAITKGSIASAVNGACDKIVRMGRFLRKLAVEPGTAAAVMNYIRSRQTREGREYKLSEQDRDNLNWLAETLGSRMREEADEMARDQFPEIHEDEKALIRLYLCGATCECKAVHLEKTTVSNGLIMQMARLEQIRITDARTIFLTPLGRDIAVGAIRRLPEQIEGLLAEPSIVLEAS